MKEPDSIVTNLKDYFYTQGNSNEHKLNTNELNVIAVTLDGNDASVTLLQFQFKIRHEST